MPEDIEKSLDELKDAYRSMLKEVRTTFGDNQDIITVDFSSKKFYEGFKSSNLSQFDWSPYLKGVTMVKYFDEDFQVQIHINNNGTTYLSNFFVSMQEKWREQNQSSILDVIPILGLDPTLSALVLNALLKD